jgi:hypothetical protein
MKNDQTNTRESVFTTLKSRNFAGLLMAFVTSVVVIPGMTTYLPFSASDQIAIPILLFPFIWLSLFVYSYLSEKSWHVWVVMLLLALSHSALCVIALVGH